MQDNAPEAFERIPDLPAAPAAAVLKGALDALDSHIALVDAQGTILFVNVAWQRFGAANGALASDVGRNYLTVCDQAAQAGDPLAPDVAASLRALLAGERAAFVLTYPCPTPECERWFRLQGTAFVYEGALYAVLQHDDTTPQMQVAQSLQTSEERYRQVWNAINDALALSDPHGTVIDANASYYRLYGGTPAEVVGQSFARIFPPEQREWAEQAYRETFHCQPAGTRFETAVQATDGTQRVVESRIDFLEQGGKRVAMLSVVRDMTERAQMEATLREQEELFRLIFDQSPLGTALVSLDYRFLRVNAAFCRMTGYSAEELTGLTFPEITYPDDLSADLAQVRRLIAGTIDHYTLDKRYMRKDGELIWVGLSRGILRDQSGAARYFLSQIEDLTERRMAEAQRLRVEQQLQASQRLESIGTLAGGIAHDFNNLLTSVQGYAELALEHLAPEQATQHDLEQLMIGVRHMVDLTQQLLAYAGKGSQTLRPLALNSVIQEIEQLLQVSITRALTLEISLTPELPPMNGDITQIRQVVLNLITNAADSMQGRSGKIEVRTGLAELTREELEEWQTGGTLPAGQYLVLTVADHGCGMDAATVRRIFEPFFSTKAMGRGLGLASVQGIVRRHKGALRVMSTPGEGTTVQVCFPVFRNGSVVYAPERTVAGGAEVGQGMILVIDDEASVRTIAQRMLQHFGYQVQLAENGEAGLGIIPSIYPQVRMVLVDLTMPNMSGEVVAQAIKAQWPQLPVLLMSGYSAVELTSMAPRLGIDGVLQKPFTLATLRTALDGVLGSPSA